MSRPQIFRSLAGGDRSTPATETEGLSEWEFLKEHHPGETLDLRTRLGLARTELQATGELGPEEPSLELQEESPWLPLGSGWKYFSATIEILPPFPDSSCAMRMLALPVFMVWPPIEDLTPVHGSETRVFSTDER